MHIKSKNSLRISQRLFVMLFTLILLCISFSCFPSSAAAESTQTMYYVENPESNILNTPSNIAIIDSMETLEGLQEGKPSNALMYIDSYLNVNKVDGTNITTVGTALPYLGNNIIPAFSVNNKEAVDALVVVLKSKSIKDALIVSADLEVAAYALDSYSIVRTAIDYTSLYSTTATEEKLLEIRRDVTAAHSLIAILPVSFTETKNVAYLQSLGVTVWSMDFNTLNDTSAVKMITSGATGIITYNYQRVGEIFQTMFVENTLTRTPLIIGHRGNPTQAPENSISGYLKAVENGADVVETDIKLTLDGEVVIMHDDSIARTTNYNGSETVDRMTLSQIKEYFLWSDNDKYRATYPDEKVPTFEEMLIALKDIDCKIFLEIKTTDQNIIQPTVDLINEYNYEDRIFVICFHASQITAFRAAMPTIGTGYLTSVSAFTTIPQMHETMYQSYLGYHNISSTYNPNYGNLKGDLIAALRHRGITCWPWTYSTSIASEFDNAFFWGIDGITTNDAQYSIDMVKKLNISENNINLFLDNASQTAESTTTITADKVTYGGEATSILSDENMFIKFIEGEDVIKYENGNIIALKNGFASFMIGYKTKTVSGAEYVLYTQPFEVNVDEVFNCGTTQLMKTFYTIVTIIAVVVIALVAFIVYFIMKKKKKTT